MLEEILGQVLNGGVAEGIAQGIIEIFKFLFAYLLAASEKRNKKNAPMIRSRGVRLFECWRCHPWSAPI